MATPDEDILFPDREVAVGGNKSIKVRELAWPDARAFLAELGGFLAKLVNEKGEIRIDVGIITEIITASDELVASLILKTTGLNKTELDKLPIGAVLELLDAALELNLSDDLLAKGKKIAGRFQKFADNARRTAPPAESV